jgi:hypothetical protein
LLAAGAQLEAADEEEQTPLLLAVSFGHADVVQLLLSEGADPAKRDKMGRTGWCMLRSGSDYGVDAVAAAECGSLYGTSV